MSGKKPTKFAPGDKVYYVGRQPLYLNTDTEHIINPSLLTQIGTVIQEADDMVQFTYGIIALQVHKSELSFATPPEEPALSPAAGVEVIIRVHREDHTVTEARQTFSISPRMYASNHRLRELARSVLNNLLESIDQEERVCLSAHPTEVFNDNSVQASEKGPQTESTLGR